MMNEQVLAEFNNNEKHQLKVSQTVWDWQGIKKASLKKKVRARIQFRGIVQSVLGLIIGVLIYFYLLNLYFVKNLDSISIKIWKKSLYYMPQKVVM